MYLAARTSIEGAPKPATAAGPNPLSIIPARRAVRVSPDYVRCVSIAAGNGSGARTLERQIVQCNPLLEATAADGSPIAPDCTTN